MSKAAPIMIIFVLLIGGIVAWGAMTDWTFSGLLPREGAKCTPEKDTKDANSTEYVYDEDEECVIVNKCKTGWEPDTSNASCIYSSDGTECTPTGTAITNGKYTFDDAGACNLTGCKNDFKLVSGKCDDCIDGYTKDGTVCRKCEAEDVTLPTGVTLNLIENVDGQTYKTEGGKCIPNRQVFEGNNGTTSCEVFCSGNDTPEGAPWVATFSEWKGAKCVGTAKKDGTKLKGSDECRNWDWKPHPAEQHTDNHCLCERNDSVPWYGNEFTMPTTFESHQLAGAWSTGTANSGVSGEYYGDELQSRTLVECREHARSKGYPAFGVRTDPNTCWGYKAGWTKTENVDPNGPATNHYTECVDPTKTVANSCV